MLSIFGIAAKLVQDGRMGMLAGRSKDKGGERVWKKKRGQRASLQATTCSRGQPALLFKFVLLSWQQMRRETRVQCHDSSPELVYECSSLCHADSSMMCSERGSKSFELTKTYRVEDEARVEVELVESRVWHVWCVVSRQ